MPKAIVTRDTRARRSSKPLFKPGGFIYEVAVRPFTILHPDVPEAQRGTVAALAHPSVIAHLKRIGVDAVELMPITAWIDERHLPPLGLTNGWGYNPVAFMALDPRSSRAAWRNCARRSPTLHAEGIGVILDLVFNHTGESDRYGATLSLRGLDNLHLLPPRPEPAGRTRQRHRHRQHARLRSSLRSAARHRQPAPFRARAPASTASASISPRSSAAPQTASSAMRETLAAILADDVLADRIMIAEPWDIGPGGYQLGNFPAPFLEWNDRVRDDLRCYWRGDDWKTGAARDRARRLLRHLLAQ